MAIFNPNTGIVSAFLATKSADDGSLTGDGTVVTVEFETEIFDKNGDYNNTTDTFTAPITGLYQFNVGVEMLGLTASHTVVDLQLTTSNRNYRIGRASSAARDADNDYLITGSMLVDMDASDTATVTLSVFNGTKAVGVRASSTTNFSGYLIR